MLTVTRVTSTASFIRYRLVSDGSNIDVVNLSNAQLLADIQRGPLRKLFHAKHLTLEQAVFRCQESRHIGMTTLGTKASVSPAPINAFSVEVGIDVDGRPTLAIGSFKLDTTYTGLLDITYRHHIR